MLEMFGSWKAVSLAFSGYVVKILWKHKRPINWAKVVAGFIFTFTTLVLNHLYGPAQYEFIIAWAIGYYSDQVLNMLFNWFKVNEDGLMRKTKQWWDK